MEPEFVEEIEDQTRTGFYVTNIPRGILKEFKKLCKENYGDIYWVGISELLKIKKKYDEISTIISSLQKQIDELKNKKKEIKTFG
ncbi:MAG TPA: hypothetical protein VMX17_03215 [Candidatus Glassbacteria bacterium]|nr:hypothetical protein [Candidatus Glassbacteria bacterium]